MSKFETLGFDSHIYVYCVKPTERCISIELSMLPEIHPCILYIKIENYLIIPKYRL